MTGTSPLRLAVWKLASCNGCQIALLNTEDGLLDLADAVSIAHFTELSAARVAGPYDVSLVEGSISTHRHLAQVATIRASSRVLVTLGSCATAGGIQALRNVADLPGVVRDAHLRRDYLDSLADSTPVADHVPVDYELHGCPIDPDQLTELLTALLHGRRPAIPSYSVCQECKARGTVCLEVAAGVPCMGPVTRAGCGALCPATGRGCFGCFGPSGSAHPQALSRRWATPAAGSAAADGPAVDGPAVDGPATSGLFGAFNATLAAPPPPLPPGEDGGGSHRRAER